MRKEGRVAKLGQAVNILRSLIHYWQMALPCLADYISSVFPVSSRLVMQRTAQQWKLHPHIENKAIKIKTQEVLQAPSTTSWTHLPLLGSLHIYIGEMLNKGRFYIRGLIQSHNMITGAGLHKDQVKYATDYVKYSMMRSPAPPARSVYWLQKSTFTEMKASATWGEVWSTDNKRISRISAIYPISHL